MIVSTNPGWECCQRYIINMLFSVSIMISVTLTLYHVSICVCITNAAGYVALLLLNVVGALSYFIASVQHSVSNQSGATFGVSLLLLVLFVPCSFVCWFRPVYNAFQ